MTRPIKPLKGDVLARHKDFKQLTDPNRKPARVVTHRGWDDPTDAQLRYIAKLAKEMGRKQPKVTTRQGASAAIKALLRHRDQPVLERSQPSSPRDTASVDRP